MDGIKGIDITDILKLRELAERLDWYSARARERSNLTRAAYANLLAQLARQDADEIQVADGIPLGTVL